MSNFKFNFSTQAISSQESDKIEKNTDGEQTQDIQWLESEEVVLESTIENENVDNIISHAKMFVCGDVEIGHVVSKEAILRIGENSRRNAIQLAEKEHSDLVPGKYEGGLKIWECTYDLVQYLIDHPENINSSTKVLDLGCGAGILGIFSLINGAKVTFQDYNKEVLEFVTIPNVLLNAEEEETSYDISQSKFYSGDWASFNKVLPNQEMFDIIVTCETIYNPDNYDKLINIFIQRLKKDGRAYVAAKTYYFGVGGGTRQFEKCIEKHVLLKSEVCWKSSDGIQREIIKITRNQDLFLID